MNKGTITSLLVILAAVTCMASADITLEVVPIDNSVGEGGPTPELAGYVTQDLVVTTDTDWLSAQMIVTLDAPGQIYQDLMGDASPQSPGDPNPQSPNPAFFPLVPSLEFDTYLSNGVLGESVSWSEALDLCLGCGPVFDSDHISFLWYTTGTEDIGTLALARVTLADTANGTWQFVATAMPQGGPRVEVPAGIVANGVMYIPEPAMMSLLGLGGLALMRRRRK